MKTHKLCPRCTTVKPLTSQYWSFDSSSKDKVQTYCKDCVKRFYYKPSKRTLLRESGNWQCRQCKIIKPLTTEFWYMFRGKPNSPCLECQHKNRKERRLNNKVTVLEHYSQGSPKCSCCKETALVVLDIDHIDGNGAEHRRATNIVGGSTFYSWLIKNNFPEGFRVLCRNCNWAFYMLGYCYHNPPKTDS